MPLLFELEFGSFLVYAPRGTSEKSMQARKICTEIKRDGYLNSSDGKTQQAIPLVSSKLAKNAPNGSLANFFANRPLLIPAPRSSPTKNDALHPAKVICQKMVEAGLGCEMRMLLERTSAVPKSAFSKAEDRPTAQHHYQTMRVNRDLAVSKEMLVVDDVITRGATSLAMVSLVQDAYPHARVRAFAFVRTMSGPGVEIEQIVSPCVGRVTLRPSSLSDLATDTPCNFTAITDCQVWIWAKGPCVGAARVCF